MDNESATEERQYFDIPFPTEMTLAAQRLWLWPLALYTCWWNTGVEALWPCPPCQHRLSYREEHDQLVVPEPIEAEGEHSLFA